MRPAEQPCHRCGTAVPTDAAAALPWSTSTDAGRVQWLCPSCTRTELRSIEARLDEAWW